MIDSSSLGSPENSRTPEQFAHMQATVGQGVCPFCRPERYADGKVLREGAFWRIIRNDFPYKHHQEHLLIIPIEHITDVYQLDTPRWAELGLLFRWAIENFKLPGGGFVLRFGDAKHNASTVSHLHAHIQVPDLTGPAKATFAKDPSPEAVAARKAKLAGFVSETKPG